VCEFKKKIQVECLINEKGSYTSRQLQDSNSGVFRIVIYLPDSLNKNKSPVFSLLTKIHQ